MPNKVLMQPPDGGEPIAVEDDGRGVNLTPLMVRGYKQCTAPKQVHSPETEE